MTKIDELFEGSEPVKVRIRHVLNREGIRDIDDLVRLNEDEVLRIPNLSMKSLNEIKATLDTIGLALSSPKDRVLVTSKIMGTAWRSILEQTIPPETHPHLVKAYKRFFYAGAKTLLDGLVYSDVLDENDEVTATPQDVNRIDAVQHELLAFFNEVAQGRQ